jgi:hypothetical protein
MKIKRILILCVILIAVISIGAYTYFSQKILVISSDDLTLEINHVNDGDLVRFSYLQSLYKTMQSEEFRIEGTQLSLTNMIFHDYNSLYYYDEYSLNYYKEEDRIILPVSNQVYPIIHFKMNYSKTHTVELIKKNVDFKVKLHEYFPSGVSLRMYVTTRGSLLLKNLIHHK